MSTKGTVVGAGVAFAFEPLLLQPVAATATTATPIANPRSRTGRT